MYYDHEANDSSNPSCPRDVVIPEGVTTLRGYAFYDKGLTSVILPSSLTHIGDSAFNRNDLTSIAFSDNIISIGRFAFYSNSLTSVILEEGLEYVGLGAFGDNLLAIVCIEAQESNVVIDGSAFCGLLPIYAEDGDCNTLMTLYKF